MNTVRLTFVFSHKFLSAIHSALAIILCWGWLCWFQQMLLKDRSFWCDKTATTMLLTGHSRRSEKWSPSNEKLFVGTVDFYRFICFCVSLFHSSQMCCGAIIRLIVSLIFFLASFLHTTIYIFGLKLNCARFSMSHFHCECAYTILMLSIITRVYFVANKMDRCAAGNRKNGNNNNNNSTHKKSYTFSRAM